MPPTSSGSSVGAGDGARLGAPVGCSDAVMVGTEVGPIVGDPVGVAVGPLDGVRDGLWCYKEVSEPEREYCIWRFTTRLTKDHRIPCPMHPVCYQ